MIMAASDSVDTSITSALSDPNDSSISRPVLFPDLTVSISILISEALMEFIPSTIPSIAVTILLKMSPIRYVVL